MCPPKGVGKPKDHPQMHMDKQYVVRTYTGTLFNLEKGKKYLTRAARWMNPEDIMSNEISQNDQYCIIPPLQDI